VPDPPPEVVAHYEEVDEDARLRTGCFQLEFARTKELILSHLPPAPAVIVDAGGASGHYSLWLASLGYRVHLVDPVPKHVEQAKRASDSQPAHTITSIRVGDARQLEFADESVDVVLLLGPLYHLTERDDRIACLREARRVLRPKGLVFAAGISRFASLLAALHEGLVADPQFVPIVERNLRDGQHRNETGNPSYFTTAYFHLPTELAAEVKGAGLIAVEIFPIEGPGWLAKDFNQLWRSEKHREQILSFVRQIEKEPELLGVSAHVLAIGEK
jgi:ubiquinone/menaquinone biosynthesis C-methylase UbiE